MRLKLLNFNEKKHVLELFHFKFIYHLHFLNKAKSFVFAYKIKYINLLHNFYHIMFIKANNIFKNSQFQLPLNLAIIKLIFNKKNNDNTRKTNAKKLRI